jgi:hypothetical protein
MGHSRTQTSSLAYREPSSREWEPDFNLTIDRFGPERSAPRLPGIISTLHRAVQPPPPERTR